MTSFPKISVSAGSDINTDNFHLKKSFPECHFPVTENIIYVCIKGQKARKKLHYGKYPCMCGQGFYGQHHVLIGRCPCR